MVVHIVDSIDSNARKLYLAAVISANRLVTHTSLPQPHVAFDCEGVDLSRAGSIELVSICFPSASSEVFLVDLKRGGPAVLKATKDLFENANVVKIIHDCRMDCDALFHLHGIELHNVHDTSCFHSETTGDPDKNINYVLEHNGLSPNDHRDHGAYKRNPSFWAVRPLTQVMIDWASSDVAELIELASRQLGRIDEAVRGRAYARSKEYSLGARRMKMEIGLVVNRPGLFIGRRGCNISGLQRRTGTLIYQVQSSGTWRVYYPNSEALATVKCAMTRLW